MSQGYTPKIDLPESLLPIETVNDPRAVKRDSLDYTSLPTDVKSWNDYEDWLTYDNSEFRADQNFNECWGDVDRLKEKFGEVWLININYGDRIRPEQGEKRYCFGFDYAIAGATEKQRRKIKRLADNYRNLGCSGEWTSEKAIKSIIPLMELIKSVPHVEGHFS